MKRVNIPLTTIPLAVCLAAACSGVDENATPATDSSEQSLQLSNSSYFTVAHLDLRRCAAPLCGGYFVKSVNLPRTTCADGSAANECHALRLDFSRSGLDPDAASRFEQELFAPQHGLVRGRLQRLPLTPTLSEEVLVVDEAWAGQALTTATGTSYALSPTGKLCITFPCDSYAGLRLNLGTKRFFNAIDLAASGASPKAVALGNEALAAGKLLAAGQAVLIQGPSGRGYDLRTSEFYLQLPQSPSGAEGDVCVSADGEAVATCGEGLKCCYPCGIQGCASRCTVPCDDGAPGCSDGCFLFP